MDYVTQSRSRSGSAQSRQPIHRRPSWAQHQKSYEIYMRKSLATDRSPGADSGLENFSYDDSHLKEWQIPKDLESRLPTLLRQPLEEWQCCGAALCTSFDRIAKLDDESLYRAYPEKTLAHLSRRPSNQLPAVFGAETPPMSSPVSPTPIALPAGLLHLEKLEQLHRRSAVGMESPPFTPVDTKVCPSPDFQNESVPSAMPDMHALTRQLSPLSMTSSRTGSAVGTGTVKSDIVGSSFGSTFSTTSSIPSLSPPTFDETAWETFLKTYSAELFDIRTHAGPRFKGAGYTVDKARIELGMQKEHEGVLADFNEWWAGVKPKMAKYDAKMNELELPNINTVRAERESHGLCI